MYVWIGKNLSPNCHSLWLKNVKYICASRSAKWERSFSDDNPKQDLYEKLGLNRSASQADIKKAYYDLTLKYHPDRNKGNDEASQKFQEVTEAYEVLGNFGMRKLYDKGMPILPQISSSVNPYIVEPNVKYQTFFDSRSRTSRIQPKRKLVEDSKPRDNPPKTKYDIRSERAEKSLEESKGQQTLISVFFGLVFLIGIYFKSEGK